MNEIEIHKMENGKVKYFNLTTKLYISKGAEFDEGDLSGFGEYYTAQIQDAIDNKRSKTFYNNEAIEDLDAAKLKAVNIINGNSEKILTEGFIYQQRVFSLDAVNRTNYHALYTASKDSNNFSTPAIDKNAQPYYFSSVAEIGVWFQTGLAFANIVYSQGGDLKNKINKSVSVEELVTYQDNRTNELMHQALASLFS